MKDQTKKYNLDKNKINPPFEVRKGYFEDLPQQIQVKIQRPESGLSFGTFWKLSIAGTMSILAILMIFVVPQKETTKETTATLDSVSEIDLMAYMEVESISETDTYDLEDAVSLALENDISMGDIDFITEDGVESILEDPIYSIEDLDTEDYLDELDLEDLESLDF